MNIVNLTPHAIVLRDVEGIPVPVHAIPDESPGALYLVSGMVLARVQRPDVFAPATGPQDGAVRDGAGRLVAVTRLVASV